MKRVFLDHNSTTPVDPEVLAEMLPYFSEKFGNPASRFHNFGWEAREALDLARERTARAISATPEEIVFTSGATESINLALKGAAELRAARHKTKGKILSTTAEHPAVLDTLAALAKVGWQIELLPVDRTGALDPAALEAALNVETVLVSVIHANNEIGTINRIAELAAIAKRAGAIFHTDATQSVGKVPVDLREIPADLLSLSAHKFYGPKGAGALFVRKGVEIAPQIFGGGHESGIRSGTSNLPGIVGLGAAIELAVKRISEESVRLNALTKLFDQLILEELDLVSLIGDPVQRIPGNLNYTILHAEGEALMMSLPDVAISSGSACASAKMKPSHVLKAIGLSDDETHSSIRIGLGRSTTEDDVRHAVKRIAQEARRLRKLSPRYELVSGGHIVTK